MEGAAGCCHALKSPARRPCSGPHDKVAFGSESPAKPMRAKREPISMRTKSSSALMVDGELYVEEMTLGGV